MKKTFKNIFYLLLVLFLVGIVLYPKLKPLLKNEGKNVAASGRPGGRGGGQLLNVIGYKIIPAQINELIRSTGSLLPDEEVDLSFETSGKLVGIFFSEGTRVAKGDLLAKMNDRHLQAQLLKLKAQRKLSEEKEFRQRQLLDRDAISRESYDQVVTELQSLEADIKLIEAYIAETELRAPFDGIVGIRMVSEGAYANPSTKIAHMVKLSPLKIEFSVPERYSGDLSPGFPITFQVDGILETFNASIYAIEPKVDVLTRTILVRALYPNTDEMIKPGRYTKVGIQLSQINDAVSIPTEAVIPEMDGEKVFVFKNGKASKVDVVTGLRTASKLQIRSGLNFGDTLLISGILQLRQNLPVTLDTLITN